MKDANLMIRLTSNEKKLLTHHAKQLNITTAELIRQQLLNGLITTK